MKNKGFCKKGQGEFYTSNHPAPENCLYHRSIFRDEINKEEAKHNIKLKLYCNLAEKQAKKRLEL